MLLIQQRYNFESNSQQVPSSPPHSRWCCLYSKDTISKAIHNLCYILHLLICGVAYTAKIQFRKQFTTYFAVSMFLVAVLLIQQRYNFESNSQLPNATFLMYIGVAYTAKIQFRKQFTTVQSSETQFTSVLLIQQRYNFESNSQHL